eukprot:420266_1
MMVMYYWLVFLIIFTKSQTPCDQECDLSKGEICCGGTECCLAVACCEISTAYGQLPCCGWQIRDGQLPCATGQIGCSCGDSGVYNYNDNAQKNSEMQDGSVNKTVAHNYYDNWWIIIAIVAVIMVVCCGGVALCWLKKVKVKAYGHVGKENEAVEEEMELQETQS